MGVLGTAACVLNGLSCSCCFEQLRLQLCPRTAAAIKMLAVNSTCVARQEASWTFDIHILLCRAFISTACDREGCSYQLGPLSCKLSISLHVYFSGIVCNEQFLGLPPHILNTWHGAPCCPPETISNTEQIPSTVGDTFRCFYDCMDSENVSTEEILNMKHVWRTDND